MFGGAFCLHLHVDFLSVSQCHRLHFQPHRQCWHTVRYTQYRLVHVKAVGRCRFLPSTNRHTHLAVSSALEYRVILRPLDMAPKCRRFWMTFSLMMEKAGRYETSVKFHSTARHDVLENWSLCIQLRGDPTCLSEKRIKMSTSLSNKPANCDTVSHQNTEFKRTKYQFKILCSSVSLCKENVHTDLSNTTNFFIITLN